MRPFQKYKKFKTLIHLTRVPVRILSFKRPKWLRLQERIKKQRAPKFARIEKTRAYTNFWEKINKTPLTRFQNYKRYSAFLDFDCNIRSLKSMVRKETNRDLLFHKLFIKPYFKMFNLLWSLGLFSSPYHVRQQVNSKFILIGNKQEPLRSDIFVKRGEVISLIDPHLNLNFSALRYKVNPFLCTMAEVDAYSLKVVTLKDEKDISIEDQRLMVKEKLTINDLR